MPVQQQNQGIVVQIGSRPRGGRGWRTTLSAPHLPHRPFHALPQRDSPFQHKGEKLS